MRLGTAPSALIMDRGKRIKLRLQGKFYELGQKELRSRLGLPAGPRGLGITIERDRLQFEFAADQQTKTVTEKQLARLLARR